MNALYHVHLHDRGPSIMARFETPSGPILQFGFFGHAPASLDKSQARATLDDESEKLDALARRLDKNPDSESDRLELYASLKRVIRILTTFPRLRLASFSGVLM